MGKNIFGVNISGIVNKAIGPGVFPLTLTKIAPGTRTTGSLTDGTDPGETPHAGRGFIETTSRRVSLVEGATALVSILGDSLPSGVAPAANDRVTIDGEHEILIVGGDPDLALYECQVVTL